MRTDSTRSSSSNISSDAMIGNKPPPPPVAHKPSLARLNQTSEEQSTEKGVDVEDPASKSFLGKVVIISFLDPGIISCHISSFMNSVDFKFSFFFARIASNMKQRNGDQVIKW